MAGKKSARTKLDLMDLAFCIVWATSTSIRQVAKRLKMPTTNAFNGAWSYKVIYGVKLRELPVRKGLRPLTFCRGPIGCDNVDDSTARLAG